MKLWFRDLEVGAATPQAAPKTHARFYTTEQLGPNQSVTPDGFLLCTDTPIARIGQQIYGEHELPGMVGKDGIITIQRDAAEVFRPEAIASFAGKPVTNNHPPEKVTPNNYRLYSVGTVLNPHQGDGVQLDSSFLYADLLINDPQTIADIRSGKREVSAGYDAEYKQIGDGIGAQTDIVGNHVALVNRGRCGPSCSIGDEEDMATRLRVNDSSRAQWRDKLLNSIRDQLEELDKVPELLGEQVSGVSSGGEGRTGDTHVSINLSGGGSSPGVSMGGGGAPVGDQPDDPVAGAPPEEAGAGGLMQQVLQRLDRIEQAIIVLAQGESQEDPMQESEDPMVGDRRTSDRRTKDQEGPSEPSTEEPMEDPGQSLPYGAGARGNQEESHENPQLGTGDKGRGTRDKRMTADQKGGRQNFVGDSSSMQTEFQDTLSRAELLVPNVRLPTFDSRLAATTTFDTLCSLRRNVLQEAYRASDTHSYIDTILGGKSPANFTQMTCDAVAMVFNGASEMARQANNSSFGRIRPNGQNVRGASKGLSIADINARNRDKYGIN